ncbi:MAG: SDR family NAD(P)-dependent oxidoreductase [Candidatus Latescibacterota bacterium]
MTQAQARIALVTGSSQGVGQGIALGLAAAGWDIGVNYHRNRQGAEDTAGRVRGMGRRAWVWQADVGDSAQVGRMFALLRQDPGRLDLLVNNAGVQTWAGLLELEEKDWDRTIRTNLKGTFLCTQQAGRLMREQGGGRIVNIGSGANKAPFPQLADYCAAKGGIENLTRVAAVELGPLGITVNCVAPGAIEIERTRQESPGYGARWGAITPLGRVGQPQDVAAAVAFLASDQATFISGQTLYVDGGLFTQTRWAYEG